MAASRVARAASEPLVPTAAGAAARKASDACTREISTSAVRSQTARGGTASPSIDSTARAKTISSTAAECQSCRLASASPDR